jgi:hypothetical protein
MRRRLAGHQRMALGMAWAARRCALVVRIQAPTERMHNLESEIPESTSGAKKQK